MIRLRFFLILLVLGIIAACSENRQTESLPSPPDTEKNRITAAKRYLAVMPPEEMMRDLVSNMAQQIPEKNRQEYVDLMTKHLDLKAVEQILLDSMVKHFTTKELDALASFYGSPEGKASMKKFGKIINYFTNAFN